MEGIRYLVILGCASFFLCELETVSADSSLFFPFGSSEGDTFLAANDDGSTAELPITVVFPFFDHDHRSLFVNNNGVISFLVRVSQYTPDPFPLDDGRRLVTPFWGDVDTNRGGTLSYREVLRFAQHEALFAEADDIVRAAFVSMQHFTSSWMYIATWDRVAFYGSSNTNIRNSFQAVLLTDGRYSFAIFNYGDINWTTGTASGGDGNTGLGGIPAQVGFNAGDGITFYSVPSSRTSAVVDIEKTTNVGVTGRWVFRTDNANIEGLECTSSGDISLFPLVGTMLGRTQVRISGPCFNDTSVVICDFDGVESPGRLLSNITALCVSPTFFKVGQIPLKVSVDGGVTFRFQGVFTILNIEDVPAQVQSVAIESDHALDDFEITWDTKALDFVDQIHIVVYGYKEVRDQFYFDGPILILAENVDYHRGRKEVSGFLNIQIFFDVGVIGVVESKAFGGSFIKAAQWSEVHVLQWHQGVLYDPAIWCLDWVGTDLPYGNDFIAVTPPCPCTFDLAVVDIARFSPYPACDIDSLSSDNCQYKPGATHCVRAILPSNLGGGQECCYDNDGFIINVNMSLGGGYSHRCHHEGVTPYEEERKIPYLSHFFHDVLPWTYCCKYTLPLITHECTLFAFQRPSQVCDNYVAPPPAVGNGDPHIATLDSTAYTFNGFSEFTMLDALNGTFVLQARMAPLSGVAATVFVAVAAQFENSDVIHVQTNERRVLDAYVRLRDEEGFRRIDFDQAARWTYSGVSVTGRNISSDGIIVSFEGGVGLKLKAANDAMSILLVAPEFFRGHTQGLMGTWNDNDSDDFLTPDGSILSPTMDTENLHYQFGLQWEIKASESLFYYEAENDHDSHTDRSYRPVFETVVNPGVDQGLVDQVCGTNQFCIFDFQTTGSQSFAQATMDAFDEYEQAVVNRDNLVLCPSLSAPDNGYVVATRYSEGGVASFACDEGYALSHSVSLSCLPNGTWSEGAIPVCLEVICKDEISVSPSSGTMLGGTQVFITGPCFNDTIDIICRFNGVGLKGRVLSNKTAICITPTFYEIGEISLAVSLDGGVTYDFQGVFTILSVENLPVHVHSAATESDHLLSRFEITWNPDILEFVNEIDIVVYSYHETNSRAEFTGPLIVLVEDVDYHLGIVNVSELPDVIAAFDVGALGVVESRDPRESFTPAALWSDVHVLQWYQDRDPVSWCLQWAGEETSSDRTFLTVTPSCPCTLNESLADVDRFSPHPECDIDSSSSDNCQYKPEATHCVRAITPSIQGGGQECCYGNDGSILDVMTSLGGGYSHRCHHGGVAPHGGPGKVPYLSHFLADILPWTYCCRYTFPQSTNECTFYGLQRPSDLCNNYVPLGQYSEDWNQSLE